MDNRSPHLRNVDSTGGRAGKPKQDYFDLSDKTIASIPAHERRDYLIEAMHFSDPANELYSDEEMEEMIDKRLASLSQSTVYEHRYFSSQNRSTVEGAPTGPPNNEHNSGDGLEASPKKLVKVESQEAVLSRRRADKTAKGERRSDDDNDTKYTPTATKGGEEDGKK